MDRWLRDCYDNETYAHYIEWCEQMLSQKDEQELWDDYNHFKGNFTCCSDRFTFNGNKFELMRRGLMEQSNYEPHDSTDWYEL